MRAFQDNRTPMNPARPAAATTMKQEEAEAAEREGKLGEGVREFDLENVAAKHFVIPRSAEGSSQIFRQTSLVTARQIP